MQNCFDIFPRNNKRKHVSAQRKTEGYCALRCIAYEIHIEYKELEQHFQKNLHKKEQSQKDEIRVYMQLKRVLVCW